MLVKNKVALDTIIEDRSLLEWAITYNRADWVTGLLAEGVDPNTKNSNGEDAVAFAERLGDRPSIIAIIKEDK